MSEMPHVLACTFAGNITFRNRMGKTLYFHIHNALAADRNGDIKPITFKMHKDNQPEVFEMMRSANIFDVVQFACMFVNGEWIIVNASIIDAMDQENEELVEQVLAQIDMNVAGIKENMRMHIGAKHKINIIDPSDDN